MTKMNNYVVEYVDYYKEICSINLNGGDDYLERRSRFKKLNDKLRYLYKKLVFKYSNCKIKNAISEQELFDILEPISIELRREAKLNYILGDTE